jgi:protein-S-isoprenylcysteine O-methyltransferase Ste14
VKKTSSLDRLIHGLIMALAFFLLILSAQHNFLEILILRSSPVIDIISVSLCLLGLGVGLWARRTLAGNWDSLPAIKKNHELVQDGPYRFVRHPIYSGVLLMFLGTALEIGMLGSMVSFIVLFTGFWIKLTEEENLMIQHFKGKYLDYKKRTRALVPYLF